MTGYVIMCRKKNTGKDLPYKEVKYAGDAEDTANQLYKELQLDRVTVVELNTKGRTFLERAKVIYKRERNCKHSNIQREFKWNREGAEIVPICMSCEEVIK